MSTSNTVVDTATTQSQIDSYLNTLSQKYLANDVYIVSGTNSGIVSASVIALAPYGNLTNRYYPTVAGEPNEGDNLKTRDQLGGYFIPSNLGAQILHPLVGWGDEKHTEERYVEKIQEFERKVEKSIMETFRRIDIHGIVKTDPYSLPYKREVKVTLRGESYLNGPYEIFRVARQICKELLDKDIYKLRFYMFINIIEPNSKTFFDLGSVEYKFRYYI